MILNETVAAIADAIREKTGKSELIKPIDFATEIKGITAGGGSGESGGSSWRYWDISNAPAELKTNFILELTKYGVSLMRSVSPNGDVIIVPTGMILEWGGEKADLSAVTQIAWDESLTYTLYESRLLTLGEMLAAAGITEALTQIGAVEITKEQFYSLE